MKTLKAKIVKCKKLGIRNDPNITSLYEETIEEVNASETLELVDNPPVIVYGWDDKKFYKVKTPSDKEGYANVECLEIIGGENSND